MIYQNYLSSESAKSKYAKVAENALSLDVVAYPTTIMNRERFTPLGKYISQQEMLNPAARAYLKDTLELQIREQKRMQAQNSLS